MADDGKKKFPVDTKINPFGEFKGKAPPKWSTTRINIFKDIKPIEVKKTIKLDPRKWKMKTLVDGCYAVARSDLQIYATQLGTVEKNLIKELAKAGKKDLKFDRSTKGESKEVNAALDKAATDARDLFRKAEKKIKDKVDLALEEAEADKGDNARSLAAGKAALARINRINIKGLFGTAVDQIVDAVEDLANEVGDTPGGADPKPYELALKKMDAAEKEFLATGKDLSNVVKYLADTGSKLAKDKGSNKQLQDLGTKITKGDLAKNLATVLKTTSSFEKEMEAVFKVVRTKKASGPNLRGTANSFEGSTKNNDKDIDAAWRKVAEFGKSFKAVADKLK